MKTPSTKKQPGEPDEVTFGDTALGQGIGCGLIILACGIAWALILWASH